MTQPKRSSAGWYLLVGAALLVLAIFIPMSGSAGASELTISLVMLVAGVVLLLIGAIATGVRIGMRNRNANPTPAPTEESPCPRAMSVGDA